MISSNQRLISQILKVVVPLGEKLDFLIPWDMKFEVL